MSYFFLITFWLLGTGLAWRRIFSRYYSWYATVAALAFTLTPILGPVLYLMIDPPESSPIAVNPDEFFHWN